MDELLTVEEIKMIRRKAGLEGLQDVQRFVNIDKMATQERPRLVVARELPSPRGKFR